MIERVFSVNQVQTSHRWCAAVLVMAIGASAVASARQERPEVKVKALSFVGNTTFPEPVLRAVMRTRKASRWPWSNWAPFDQRILDADLERLKAFHIDQGFPDVKVRLDEVKLSADGKSVTLRVAIDEGVPLTVGRAWIEGLDGLPPVITQPANDLGIVPGVRRDSAVLIRSRDRVLGVLREHGYPYARVSIEEQPVSAGVVNIRIIAVPGGEARFGEMIVNGLNRTKQVIIRRAVTFREGDLYRESAVTRSQRRLAGISAFEFANLTPEVTAREAQVPELPMVVTVTEAKRHRFEFGVGYGTEDRVRGTFEWRDQNFFGNGSQLIANAKYSKVLRDVGFGYEHPYLLPSGGTLSVQASSKWREETLFSSRSAGGSVAVRHAFGGTNTPSAVIVTGWEATGTYRNELLTYQVRDAALADLGSVDERIALGLDPVTGRGDGTMAGLELDVSRRSLDSPADPSKGTTFAFRAVHVAPWLGGTFKFSELATEVRGYLPVRGQLRVAGRVRAGTLIAKDTSRFPFSQRYFLGGSSSVRGWSRFQISPTSASGVPIGGRSVLEGSAEVRFPIWSVLGGVAFVDAGRVGSEQWDFSTREMSYAAGGGLRYLTVVGVVRVDVAFQLNPIEGLRVQGQPQKRSYRIHLSIGHAF